MSLFSRFFQQEEILPPGLDAAERAPERAHEILAFASLPYYGRFMQWLEREALRPLPMENANELVKAAVRSNTFKEVRQRILRDVEAARGAVAPEGEDTSA